MLCPTMMVPDEQRVPNLAQQQQQPANFDFSSLATFEPVKKLPKNLGPKQQQQQFLPLQQQLQQQRGEPEEFAFSNLMKRMAQKYQDNGNNNSSSDVEHGKENNPSARY